LQDGGQYVQRAMLVYPRDSCGNTACCLFAHMLVCIAQTGLEPASGSMEVLPFSQCNVEWRRFVWSGGLGCPSFASSWWFYFCYEWLQHLSKIFDLWSSCCLLPPSSRHLGFSMLCFRFHFVSFFLRYSISLVTSSFIFLIFIINSFIHLFIVPLFHFGV
jgi:hypothetical protein